MHSKRLNIILGLAVLGLAAWACGNLRAPFTKTIDEDQLKAKIEEKLEKEGLENNVSDLEVTLADGLISLDFTLSVNLAVVAPSTPGTLVFEPQIDDDGGLVVNTVSANFGKLNLPDEILNTLNQTIVDTIVENARQNARAEVEFTAISVEDNAITLSGYLISIRLGSN